MNSILHEARILVADDQNDVARTLSEPLRLRGASVVHVTDGAQALKEVRRGGYDLALLDMKMPPGDWGVYG
ncbi:response regulator [Micromonospora zhanjiangensis]